MKFNKPLADAVRMGIKNLLPFVKKACRKGNIDEFAGQSIAVDVSCLLHRGIFGCVEDLVQGSPTNFYVTYVLKYIRTLLNLNCHVIVVFDGQPLPAKHQINENRRKKRKSLKARAEQLLEEGKNSQALQLLRQTTEITDEIVQNTIKACRELNNVDVIVAPYEADAQLTYLTMRQLAYAVVTEDSDLIAFGCEKIIFKMDPSTRMCTIYERHLLHRCLIRALSIDFNFCKFRRICILAGCDYLQSGYCGVGLVKACNFFAKTSDDNLEKILPRIPHYLNMSGRKITAAFIDDFIRAENTFLYQVVFDVANRQQVPLNPYPNGGNFDRSKLCYAGKITSQQRAIHLALGNLGTFKGTGAKMVESHTVQIVIKCKL